MKKTVLSIFGAVCGMLSLTAQEASVWKTEELSPGIFQLYNDTGKFLGPQKAAIPISGAVIKIRKTFDLNALPPGLLKKATKASIRLYMAVYDYSGTKNPDKKFNGLTEEIVFNINGRDVILKTSDPRFPAKRGEKDPLHYRWVDVEFPVDWIADGKLVVEAFKNPSQTHDDYFYPTVDITVPNRSSEISTNYGKTWSSKWGNLSEKGEYMLRLILNTTGVKKSESMTPSDVSFGADAQNFHNLKLHDGASLLNGVLHLDGKKGYAVLPGSENWNIPPEGATFVAVVRFASSGNGMLIHKEGAFFLGRTGNRINLSLCCDGKTWSEALVGGELPPPGEWIHFAAVVEPFSETAQGTGGYHLRVYLNGELFQQKKIGSLKTMLDKSNLPVEIGQSRFKHETYHLNGDIAEIGLYNRVMTDQEISCMVSGSPYVENRTPGMFPLMPSLEKSFAGLKKETPFRKWAFASLKRAVENGFDPLKMETLLPTLATLSGTAGTDADFIWKWNGTQSSFFLADSGKGVLMLCIGNGQKNFPVAGFFNRINNAPVFADRTMEWTLTFRKNGREQQVESFDGSFQWQVAKPVMSAEGFSFRIDWKNDDFTVVSEALFRDGRLEMNLKAQSRNPEVLLTEVHFPRWYFARLPGTDDQVVYPHMSGIVVDDPLKNISMSGIYPRAQLSMLFSAYYDKIKRNGIYFGFEDPLGRTKQYSVTGKLDKLRVDWASPVAYPFGARGGNGYEMSGKAVLEVYRGDWFEAGQIYRKFVSEKAEWRHERPRRDTPKWYRENTLWLLAAAGKREIRELLALAEYFDAPCTINWAYWYDFKIGDWPHFFENQVAEEGRVEFHKRGIKVRPYINGRLWGLKDGPYRKSDWMYSSRGARFAAKDENQKPYQEVYPEAVYSVMCPAAAGWREHLLGEAGRTIGYGYDALYWDQVSCGLPLNCQDASHGHLSNDPSLWLEQGYWKLFAELRKKFPDIALDGEDISEPYLKHLDGAFVWRWLDASHVPLFQSIYCGQVQFVARVFDPGDYQSYFSKMGEQTVYGEQLAGFLHINNMRYASPQRLYLKRMAHLRGALLHYFNEADMLRPLDFKGNIPTVCSDWTGGKNYDTYGNGIVTTPKVLHSVWKRNDGRIMILFINTVNETVSLHPILPFGDGKILSVCRENGESPESCLLNGKNLPSLTLPPYKAEVWLLSEQKNSEEINAVHGVLKKMNSFRDYGPMLTHPQDMSARKKLVAESGKWINVLESSWMSRAFMPKFSCIGFRKTERWLQADKDAEVFFGEVNFGQGQGNALEFEMAVDPPRAGGMVEMWIREPGTKQETCVAVLKTEPLGDWFDYKTVRVPLNAELKGKQEVTLRFREKGCNLRGWRIVR